MSVKKYGQYVKEIPFQSHDSISPAAWLDNRFFGLEVNIQISDCHSPGNVIEGLPDTHTHDFNQVILWMGTDLNDIGSLGAEIELTLGAEKERHVITTSSAVFIPRGLPHFPATVTRVDKAFLWIAVSVTSAWNAIPVLNDPPAPVDFAGWGAKYRNLIVSAAFQRKGAWHYGPQNRDDSGGYLTFLRNPSVNPDFLLLYESIKKAPYRFDPDPTRYHVHPQPEILFFLGNNMDNLTTLGGEVEVSLGEEMEKFIVNRPSAVVVPAGLPHNPLTVTRVQQPLILLDVRPFGHGGSNRPTAVST